MKKQISICLAVIGVLLFSACTAVEFDNPASEVEVPIVLSDIQIAANPSTRLALQGDGSSSSASFQTNDQIRLTVFGGGDTLLTTTFKAQVESGKCVWVNEKQSFWPKNLDGYELSYLIGGKHVQSIADGDMLPDVLSRYITTTQIPDKGIVKDTLRHKMAQLVVQITLKGDYCKVGDILSENPTVGEASAKVALKGVHNIAKVYSNGTFEEDETARDIHLQYKQVDGNVYTFFALVPAAYPLNKMTLKVAEQEFTFRTPTASGNTNSFAPGTSYTYQLNMERLTTSLDAPNVQAWINWKNTIECVEVEPWNGSVATTFAGGNGLADAPILISSAEQLARVAQLINLSKQYIYSEQTYRFADAYYKLTADIDLNNLPWTPIGYTTANTFNGNFDGDNHTITGLNVSMADGTYVYGGLFGKAVNATIKNISVSGTVNMSSDKSIVCAGGILGYASPNTRLELSNCYFNGEVSAKNTASGDAFSGGIVGYLNAGKANNFNLSNSIAKGSVTTTSVSGKAMVGGIAGRVTNTKIAGCKVLGMKVTNQSTSGTMLVGGMVGSTNQSVVDGCVAVNNNLICGKESGASGRACVGGVIGESKQSKVLVSLNYGCSLSALSAKTDSCMVGGLVGMQIGDEESNQAIVANSLLRDATISVPQTGVYADMVACNVDGVIQSSYSNYSAHNGTSTLVGKSYTLLINNGIESTLNSSLTGKGSAFQWILNENSVDYTRYLPKAVSK